MRLVFQSPFSGDFLCFSLLLQGWNCEVLSISIFRRFSLFRVKVVVYVEFTHPHLSISIFRRFSLFPWVICWREGGGRMSFNLHFQEIFFVSGQGLIGKLILKFSFNLHFQEIFFVSRTLHIYTTTIKSITFNLHFQEIFFVSEYTTMQFRTDHTAFNLHFQEIFFVSRKLFKKRNWKQNFQSPFSGDFLCFVMWIVNSKIDDMNFQSPFSGDFLCFSTSLVTGVRWTGFFQSPFSGDFLCFYAFRSLSLSWVMYTFNLHFQEIFFVSNGKVTRVPAGIVASFNLHFQEIFFVSVVFLRHRLGHHLLPFNLHFQEIFFVSEEYERVNKIAQLTFNLHFQEIFFVSSTRWKHAGVKVWALSISIFRRFSLFRQSSWRGSGYRK